MRVAVIGAGFTGLACAVELVDMGIEVEVFEKSNQVGGLAGGWIPDQSGNDRREIATVRNTETRNDDVWSLEYFYHHVFTNDADIIDMAKKVGLPPTVYSPITSSLINGKILQLDSPVSVLRFSELSILARIRMGLGLAVLKLIPSGTFLEKYKVVDLLPKLIGEEAYGVVWEKLMRAKFGSKAKVVNMAWFWSRVAKRTKNLGYFDGGFESLAKKMQEYIEKKGGKVILNTDFNAIKDDRFDKVIVTTPGPLADRIVGRKLMPPIDYLWAQTLILEVKESLMENYWLNILEKDWPFLVAVEHTNFIDKKHYGNKRIIYLGNYLEEGHKQLSMEKKDILKLYSRYLKKINPKFEEKRIIKSFLFRSPFAQPVFPVNYSKMLNKVPKEFGKYLFANMSMVYPFDRGTNYAVKLGVEVAKKCHI